MNNNKKKILIVGGGIAGVTLAAFLKDSEYDITIIERAHEWRTIGYAVSIWMRGLEILRKLNLPESFWGKTIPIRRGVVLSDDGTIVSDIRAFKVSGHEPMARSILREDLHRALIEKIPQQVRVCFQTHIKMMKQLENKMAVNFSDDSEDIFDLVVGADGMRSWTRQAMFGDFLKSYGWHMVAGWCKNGYKFFDGYDTTVQFMSMPAKAVLTIPSHDRVFFGFSVPYSFQTEDLFEDFKKTNPRLKDFVDNIERDSLYRDELVRVVMSDWYKGNVVLIGDARHGLSPVSGFGTTLALEDAYVLAGCLKNNESITKTLADFSEKRDKLLRKVYRFARIMERAMMIKSGLVVKLRNTFSKYFSPYGQVKWLEKVLKETIH